ncbi:MAG: diguanylate cyclase [Gammaproteobacteria bacterium]|jgi:diguanylate cyclase (GGDEF)-like protein|nr:diguanylate cyclase [Gammaproteobacteria bacterium]MDH3863620.1 diguanylate cyclase [Gammaproteobacteria bacterium]MDH3904597.1 diguanylate cyclase [Gammaproteobacteria bacterium]MDH3954838.1 diguanylate cyclase [Gammaproteobacteria bacterium]MDH4004217.1 diguanylate cyclase [Gammaproteobacteria bacterium]
MNLDIALSIVLIFSAACYLLLGVRLIVAKREVGSVPIGVLFVIISFWVMGGAVELMSESFLVFSIGRTGHFIGTALLPLAAFVCFREYTGATTPLRTIVLLLIVPTVSITLAATNPFHEFMWQLPAVSEDGQYLTRPDRWGPWFLFVHAPHSYALIGAAIFTLLVHSSAVAPAHRRGLFLLVAACVGPLIATSAYDLGFGSNVISFVSLVFAAMLPIYAWLIVGEGIVEFTPLAYETVFQNMQDPVIVIDEQQRIIGLNHCAETMLSVSEHEALRTPLNEIFKDGATVVFEALETHKPQKMMTTTGRFLHVQVSPIQSDRSSVRGGRVLMFRDVSDVEKAQSEVRKSEKLLRTLIDHSVNGVIRLRWVQDEDYGGKDLRCIFANAAAGRFLDCETDDLVDLTTSEIARRAMTGMDAHTQQSILEQLEESCEAGESVDLELMQSNGDALRWLRLICEPVGDDIAATLIDVTDSKAKERQMESIAWSDPLTGVLNRRGFERDAAQRLTDSADDATGALLFIDLNEFKDINDQYGHVVGDQLLTIAAQRLRKSLRSQDIIGRPGGDEFVALVPDVSAAVADKLAQRLAKALEAPYNIGTETMSCAASIGLALYPTNANTLTGLLREADQAMYRAKARTRGSEDLRHSDLLEKAI